VTKTLFACTKPDKAADESLYVRATDGITLGLNIEAVQAKPILVDDAIVTARPHQGQSQAKPAHASQPAVPTLKRYRRSLAAAALGECERLIQPSISDRCGSSAPG